MKNLLFLFALITFTVVGCKKEAGCTDKTANNYSSTAEEDDGSCTYDVVQAQIITGSSTTSGNTNSGTTNSGNTNTNTTQDKFVGEYDCTYNGVEPAKVVITESSGVYSIYCESDIITEHTFTATLSYDTEFLIIDECTNFCYNGDYHVNDNGIVDFTNGKLRVKYQVYDEEAVSPNDAHKLQILEN